MNLISGAFHDGVMLYSQALNETLDQSGVRPPGDAVTKKMWNRTYHGQSCLEFIQNTDSQHKNKSILFIVLFTAFIVANQLYIHFN